MHLFPGRSHKLQPRFSDEEMAAVKQAAKASGLTPTGYTAAVTVAAATNTVPPTASLPRQALAELMEARAQVRMFASNVNQAAKALNSGADEPEWLARAVELTNAAVRRLDAATTQIVSRLP
ncbi:plasmid mobilization protein [Motilibacter aurantiacus]|uniref:plasmid mobilization protein n=1 Tax=Motilibacter aurantiacus TaxID=2714955 RepID=UPI001408B8E6|nr:hypothetical protein [Motilibacter aurantiacus]NHC47147.1 hypothetical protein [Motilibacter aurantiacus]